MNPSPVVSVIIPTYRHEEFVEATLESVFAQSFTDFEIIVVNDGSPDRTADRLRPLADAGRIRYFEQANAGQAAARNRGLSEARGEFVAFLDDDDLWPPEKLAWQVAVLRADHDAGVVYGQKFELGSDDPLPGHEAPDGQVFAQFLDRGWIQSPGQVLIRKSVLDLVGGFDPAIWGTDDWELWLRLARETLFRYRPLPALIYRRHASNASKNFLRMWKNGHAVIRKILAADAGADALRQRGVASRFVDDFTAYDGLAYAEQLMSAGRLRDAATALMQVWRIRGFGIPDRLYLGAWHRLVKRFFGRQTPVG